MADAKPPTLELVNLRERETVLLDKQKRIDGMDANELSRAGVDINEVKRRNSLQLAEIRKAIEKESK